jgi:hypothetical protein
MSALGQKQTYAAQKGVSALPSIADMCAAMRDVRYVPIADIRRPLKDESIGQRLSAAAGAIMPATLNREFESHLGALLLDGN